MKSNFLFTDTFAAARESASIDTTRYGWTAGVGGEYVLMNGWSVKPEYLYVDLGRVSTTSANLTAFTPPSAFPANVFTHFSPETSAIKAPHRPGLFVPRPRESHPRRD